MKKALYVLLLTLTIFGLAACNKTEEPNESGGDINLRGDTFTIMADFADRVDPRSEKYERLFREEKIKRLNEVQEKYNVKIEYVSYPSNASWGGARERWIVEQSSMGSAPAHVYEVSSTSIGTLAVQEAILPLDHLIKEYGNEAFWPEKKLFGKVLDKHYSYDDNYVLSDDGLYYNTDLLARVLGSDRKLEPTEQWLAGEWTWDSFEKLALELKEGLDHTRSQEEGGPEYVFGGRTYNWVYPMVGANGGVIVDSNFKSHLSSEPVYDTISLLGRLYQVDGMWKDDAMLNNASQPEFTAGNIAFHNGSSWHINANNKWGNADFPINFVPYPVGPNVKADMSNYAVNHVYGKSSFVISSSYSKDNVPEGYEDKMIYDEIIFQIWDDLQYFPEIDEETGYGALDPIKNDFYAVRLLNDYGDEVSREAHLSIFDLAKPDLFYSIPESQAHLEDSYMLMIQQAIREGDIRQVLKSTESELQAKLDERFLS